MWNRNFRTDCVFLCLLVVSWIKTQPNAAAQKGYPSSSSLSSCLSGDHYLCSASPGAGDKPQDADSKQMCVPASWLCDGDRDCPFGDDELHNCTIPACSSTEFQCQPNSRTRCISKTWQCDGESDCDHGEDEAPEICRRLAKKGQRVRGVLVDTFSCLPNHFRCPGTRKCISMSQVCDNKVDCQPDGVDEGPFCNNRACRIKNCPDPKKCKETFQGAQCYCEEGQKYVDSKCTDFNECDYNLFLCDQKCQNEEKSYNCSCVPGYELVGRGHCQVSEKTAPRLVLASFHSVQLLFLNGSDKSGNTSQQIGGFKITALDVDIRNNSACWVTFRAATDKSHFVCADINNFNLTWEIHVPYSLDNVKAVAKDWVSGNWYFADDVQEMVLLCSANGSYCMPVVTVEVKRPRSLAIDSTRGFLFLADWSSAPFISRVNLDGQSLKKLAEIKVVHPAALTLDVANSHLYWGDSFLDAIERIDYNGKNRMVIAKGDDVFHISGMVVLENYLYVANHFNNSIIRIHRYNSSEPDQIVVRASWKPGTMKMYHPVIQPLTNDSDVCRQDTCDHLCIPIPFGDNSIQASCRCYFGYNLHNNRHCFKENSTKFLLLTNGQQGMVHSISIDPRQADKDVYPPIHNLRRPNSVDFDSAEEYIYFSDVTKHTVKRRKFYTDTEAEDYLSREVNCDGLSVDWIGRNLFCADSSRNGSIIAISLRNSSKIHTVFDHVRANMTISPKALVVDAEQGLLYWTEWVFFESTSNGSINRMNMDGSNPIILAHEQVQWPNGLVLDSQSQTLYWADAFYDRIEAMSTEGTNRRVILDLKNNQHPFGLAKLDDVLWWADSVNGSLFMFNLTTNVKTVHRRNSPPVFDIKLYDPDSQKPNTSHPCQLNNGGCSDLCLPSPGGSYLCRCADGRSLGGDGHNCTGDIAPNACQKISVFKCRNGQCIDPSLKCNGKPDCLDESDEDTNPGGVCGNKVCPSGMFLCKTSQACIYPQFVCDGEDDCAYREDEIGCLDHTCGSDYFQCSKSKQCIHVSWKCDGERDCPDGSDEGDAAHCCPSGKCGPGNCTSFEFTCLDGRCIHIKFRCDNEYDCSDNSDELDCGGWCDPSTEFKCKNDSGCLPRLLRCDGELNCADGSDEADCEIRQKSCHRDEFSCSDGTCLKKDFLCDGTHDCFDGSDERNCTLGQVEDCHWTQFRCDDRTQCIPAFWQCDKEFDCLDKSDEKHCDEQCQPPKFACENHRNMCLDPEKLCDNVNDCPDHSDEGRLCEYDLCLNHDCEEKCHKSPKGIVCSCGENKRLRSDLKTCVDINICEKWGICSQQCQPTPQGHKCLCNPGYTLTPDGYSCKHNDSETAYIIFSNRHEIRRLNIQDHTITPLVSGLRNTIALDFHYEKSLIFWTDVVDDKIYRGEIKANAVVNIEPIIEFGLATTEGVAVDWIANNIYWVESNLDQIEVARLDGSNRTTLIAGNMTSPRAIVLDPSVGKLFWTDWDGVYPRIETCSLAGEPHTRDVVYDIRNYKGAGWPNGLAIDYESNRLYWVDARSDSIHSITYEGKDHQMILKSHRTLNHPFSLTIFEHHVYWTDWRFNTLAVANKFNGSDVAVIQRTYTQPFDLQVYHPKRQPRKIQNPCEKSRCSHLCLIGEGLKAVCRCPHRFKLSSKDNFTCIGDDTFLLFAKENEIRGVDLDHAHYNVIPSITVPFVENATSIDYDARDERVYWTDIKKNVITSAYLNGTGITTIIDSGLSNPSAFAIDWMSRNMYFSSYTESMASISVSKLDGAFRKEIYSHSKSKPNSMAIHPFLGLMFWSDVGGSEHAIWRAYMDGQSSAVFAKGETVKQPTSLTLDLVSNLLYWISREESVYSCNITSSITCLQPDKLSFTVPIPAPISMTIYRSHDLKDVIFLFGANKTNIIKYYRGSQMVMREDTPNVYDLMVYDPSSRTGKKNVCSEKNGECEQLCLPSGDSYVCECTVGYQQDKSSGKVKCKGIEYFLLYSLSSEIHGITMDTRGDEALATISKISLATSVDFHAATDHIYWVDSYWSTISRIKRDLSERETVVSDGISGAESLAVDWIAGNIYWTDQGHNIIEVTNLNGTNRHIILHDDIEKPRSIVVHPAKGYLYFATGGSRPRIIQARLDGSERKDLVVNSKGKPVKAPYGLAVDYDTDDLYWCDKDTNTIERVAPNGTRSVVLSTNLTECMSLAIFNDKVFWADVTDLQGSIKFANKITGQGIEVMVKGVQGLKDIKVFDAVVQRGENPCKYNNGGCQGLCLYRGNDQVTCACSYGKLAADNKTCEKYEAFLLYSEVTALKSLPLDNSVDQNAPLRPIEDEQHMKNVIGLTFDYLSQRIFFSDIQQGNIQSVFFNGTGLISILSGAGSAEGLAFDTLNRHLYWTSYSGNNVNRIIFGSSGISGEDLTNEVFVHLDSHDHPRDIVVNSCVRRVFWTNWSDRRPAIQAASFDSHGRNNGTESIITDKIRTPNGLTMDYKANKLYWSDAHLDKIERCDFDGSNRIVIVATIPQHSFGLAVYGDFLYWTDWMLRAVIRANKYDGSGVTWLKKNINRQPMGIIAVAADTDDCTLNACYKNAFGCSEICLVDETSEASCQCTQGKKLIGGKKCILQSVEKCEEDDFVCEDQRMCIPFDKTCNNYSDCLDASDESKDYCNNRDCPFGWYQCQDSRKCIPQKKVCDVWNDCPGGSDESNCPCSEHEFRCTNGMCILDKYKCDYDSDCPDHSDEVNCNKTCDDLEISGVKHHGLVPCNTTSMCIYPSWICDGSNDCWDNNDEAHCDHVEPGHCAENAFKCANDQCILPQWRCDKEADCTDGSDEVNCTYSCDSDQHTCNDYTCFPLSWVCDGNPDCPDGSDEPENCTQQNCTDQHFQCQTGRCIPKEWLCDGDHDCPNGEDERMDEKAKCAPMECARDQFLCQNRRCIKASFYCDGENDCGDSSDEPDTCVHKQCADSEFNCSSRCIPLHKRCNGMIDCPDHADERDCPNPTLASVDPCQNKSLFSCNNSMCISLDLVCNNNNDCGDGSDEPYNCHINECNRSKNRPICSQVCLDKVIGYECQCFPGYQMETGSYEASPNRKCLDVNECTSVFPMPCSQHCTNTAGSFKCSCSDGYLLLKDSKTCVATGPEPLILISNRYNLRLISLTRSVNMTLTSGMKNSVAVDYDWKDQMIYWSDITSDKSSISRLRFNFTSKSNLSSPEVLHNNTVRNPDGLAVDWIGRNLYWCDKTTDTIEVSRLDGKFRKVLLREGIQEPRALEVFPQKGLLFFSDWGENPHISRMNMDGTGFRQIINESIAWPNALTIDYITEKVFWADGNLDYIGMADLDGRNARVIVGDNKKTPHVFALTTFEGLLYWTDWESKGVFYTSKFTGHNVTNIIELIYRPMDIQIVHPLRQVSVVDSQGLSPCDYMGCTHLCLLRPGSDDKDVQAVCSCPEYHDLAPDGRTCISNCSPSQFLCATTSKCIPWYWKCDIHPDCEDGSDEPQDCGAYHCGHHGMFQCQNATSGKECILPIHICDGIQQCDDGSDENVDTCASFNCLEHYTKCHKTNTCIPKTDLCDGKNDCLDGEDERNCTTNPCVDGQYQCHNKKCIPFVWKCDGTDDCGDNSDEPENCSAEACSPEYFKCKRTGKCIMESWKCDGDQDCGDLDSSDEDPADCDSQTCDPTFFRCTNGHCIPSHWKCDYFDDCRDGSDEMDCISKNCSDNHFRCANKKCIPLASRCNGFFDCADRSDEANCSTNCNPVTQFQCRTAAHCIPKRWQCDGDTDCADGTDEWGCSRTCTENEFKCNNSMCQPLQWYCDGDDDCGDGSDEISEVCASHSCPLGRFRCRNHICIWNNKVCDRKKDCPDGEDEDDRICAVMKNCSLPNFLCKSMTQCLQPHQVCDQMKDCNDGSDESTDLCENLSGSKVGDCQGTNICQHFCNETLYGPQCSCKEFYLLNPDGVTCSFDNPCDHHDTCSQICEFDHSHWQVNCSCREGYTRVKKACLATGDDAHVLIAEKNNLVLRKRLHSDETDLLTLPPPLQSDDMPDHLLALDVDISNNIVFFINQSGTDFFLMRSQLVTHEIKKQQRRQISNNLASIVPLSGRHFDMQGLAVDWVTQSLYLTDSTGKAVHRYSYSGHRGKVIAKGDMASPHTVVVDPLAGFIFWTDRGSVPKIERANLDGSDRRTIIQSDLSWPGGLALDTASGWLYWTDTKRQRVEVARYDGSMRKIVHSSTCFQEDSPAALDVFEDFIYVLTQKQSQVLKLHKFKSCNEHRPNILFNTLMHAKDILIVQENKQPTGNNNCTPSACDPEESCFNKPQDPKGFVCLCPDGADKKDKKCTFEKPDCHNYCLHGGTCVLSEPLNKRKCSCTNGFSGDRCEIYSCTDYCKNGGICHIDLNGNPQCLCSPFYQGVRCEISRPLDTWCAQVCKNGANCIQESSGYITCQCQDGFHGKRCDQCDDLTCDNGGFCERQQGQPRCVCPLDLDPRSHCRIAINCTAQCLSDTIVETDVCNCRCKPTFRVADCACELNCGQGLCQMNGSLPHCLCDTLYQGTSCDKCKCQPGGDCDKNSTGHPICRCKTGWSGLWCEINSLASQEKHEAAAGFLVPVIIVCVVVVIIIGAVAMIIFVRRRSQRVAQFGHKRMNEHSNLNVTNPVYMKRDEEEEDPLNGGVIFTGDDNGELTNAIYSDSTQKLLSAFQREENHNFEDLKINFAPAEHSRDGYDQGRARTSSA